MQNLPNYGVLIDEIEPPTPNDDLLRAIKYACRYWVHHFKQSDPTPGDIEDSFAFFETHFLYWLEALSLMRILPEIIGLINDLKALALTANNLQFSGFLSDATRFILANMSISSTAPLQLYVHALMFAPAASIVRGILNETIPKWISKLPLVSKKWGSLVQTLQHDEPVEAIAFSPDGQLIASSERYMTIRVWDTATGSLQKIIWKWKGDPLSDTREK
ncbi:hypothetical protein BO71DRAFT_405713 [Aspergillus ellipticus CBS 707.79]|uniref:Uncharacterized protein n=1 Tax=Aspergillus ellipticus CBS 707.79 TaxID=1448320 RepID=A0A319DXN7_9EURO|nr:hypothetical protein BO71DRAFT_405713 [Aspergillus ellipticus CBS 707.79]